MKATLFRAPFEPVLDSAVGFQKFTLELESYEEGGLHPNISVAACSSSSRSTSVTELRSIIQSRVPEANAPLRMKASHCCKAASLLEAIASFVDDREPPVSACFRISRHMYNLAEFILP